MHAIHASDEALPGAAMMGCNGLSFEATPLCAKMVGAMPFQFVMQASNSFSAPTKFVPISDQIVLDVPGRAMNRSIPMTQELVSRDSTISRCTVLVVRQVKRNFPSFFSAFANRNVKRSKVIHTCMIKGWLLVSKTFDR